MMESGAKKIWDIAEKLIDAEIHEIDIMSHEDEDGNECIKIFHADGYCFDLKKAEPSDELEEEDADEDGFYYSFFETWDGFQEAGLEKATEILEKSLA